MHLSPRGGKWNFAGKLWIGPRGVKYLWGAALLRLSTAWHGGRFQVAVVTNEGCGPRCKIHS